MGLIKDHLIRAVRQASVFNPAVQVAPACILWPDRDRQWEAVIPHLQVELPELFILGDYDRARQTGPAIWLRCIIAGKADDISLPLDHTPIFYLPGVSRQDLRAVESCPDYLKPLAELQYRGVIWSQLNAKDWTILAFLKSDQGGLGLDVAQDNDTKNAMQLAVYDLLDEDTDLFKGKRLDRDYFNTLLIGDPVRDLLQWLDLGDAFRDRQSNNQWQAFIEVCKSQLAFNPEADGILEGATRLAKHDGPWKAVWDRYCEAPKRYPGIPDQIRKCKMPSVSLFSNADTHGGWPQWNTDQEDSLRGDLNSTGSLPPHKAREKIITLEKMHTQRRDLVWAELGESPLALALKHLKILAEKTTGSLAAGTVEDMVAGYMNSGWCADNAVVRSLSCVEKNEDYEAVSAAIRAVYLPWAEESARHLQAVVESSGYPGGTIKPYKPLSGQGSECILFVDGLRFDMAKRLSALLAASGCTIEEKQVWSALPSVTATGKAAVSPVCGEINGKDSNADFEPSVAETGQSLKGGYHFKKLLQAAGWEVLNRLDVGDGQGKAWCEFGNIDHEGHERGWKVSQHLVSLIKEVAEKVLQLINAGWENVRVVTDHGWLLLPGGLPKIDLHSALTENKWGRCAAIKPGASITERLFPWSWNSAQHFALADGISCFRNGIEYSHGGLSLQECLNLELRITAEGAGAAAGSLDFTDITWKGLRCSITVDNAPAGLSFDIRSQAGNPSSSLVVSVKPLKKDDTASVLVENEDREGEDASLVLLNSDGVLVAQCETKIGGENI